MGLDVYLYRYEDFAATKAAENAAEAFSEQAWKFGGAKYEALTETQKDEAKSKCAAHNIALGLDEWGDDKTRKAKVEIASAKYPEHYFKIGYFRSSYNGSGFNRIAQNLIGMGLDDVFQSGDQYEFKPDWVLAREAALELHRKLAAAPKLRALSVDAVSLFGATAGPPVDAARAISLVQEQRNRAEGSFRSYSNRDGEFYLDGLKIIGAIPGKGVLKQPCVHLVYEDEGFDWYIQAAEIVIETIDYVLSQPDRDKYWLHWSS